MKEQFIIVKPLILNKSLNYYKLKVEKYHTKALEELTLDNFNLDELNLQEDPPRTIFYSGTSRNSS